MHQAVAKNGLHVAVKIQYPGVADSIESDIDNVKLLLDYTNLIPENLFLDKAMKVTVDRAEKSFEFAILLILQSFMLFIMSRGMYCFAMFLR